MEEPDERAQGMALALENSRGLHDKVRQVLGSLRLSGSGRAPAAAARLQHADAAALDAVRAKLQQLEDLLEESWALPPSRMQQQAEVLCAVDETRGDLIATCRECAQFVTPTCQALISEVLAFCEIGSDEDVTPREFNSCWRAAADAAASSADVAASSAEGGVGADRETASPDASPLQGGRANEATSAAPRARGPGGPLPRGGGAAAAGAGAAAGSPARQVAAERDAPTRLNGTGRVMWLDGAGESGASERAPAAAAAQQPQPQRRSVSLRQPRERGDQAAAAGGAAAPAGAAARRGSAAARGAAQQPQPAHHARYADYDAAAGAAAADVPRPAAARDSSQFGGKLSVRRYAQAQGEGSDDSAPAPKPSVTPSKQLQRRRDTDRAPDVATSREMWLRSSTVGLQPHMRVLQDAVTMSREDLQRLEDRSRRRGRLVSAAKAIVGLVLTAALGAAGVITVRAAIEEYGGGGGGGSSDDIQLEPLAPRLPSLRGSDGEGRRRGRGRGRESGGPQMPQMPFAPVFPAPNPLDSRA
ncbi:hypothetical protein Rsub_06462 [Raphidocelis subcapitata]|uniref:Uncharacterized protein n=1 Tax=Raphidocelis subcapitata TaxID=307507 RepID=A0A2V0P5I9_9CHLO|nr:hypothetical protein Rsub_06462 [Raphidocelis subcapitata]|eukprot:GBF94192.1 hypothetical protein Rsub_06462 [Raphidocelis subcapitata]